MIAFLLISLMPPSAFILGTVLARSRGAREGWSAGYLAGLQTGADLERKAICTAVAEGKQLARLAGRAEFYTGVN